METRKLHLLIIFVVLLEGRILADPNGQVDSGGSSTDETSGDKPVSQSTPEPKPGIFKRAKHWYHDKICTVLNFVPPGLSSLILLVPNLKPTLVRENPPISCAKLVLTVEYRVTRRRSELFKSLALNKLKDIWVIGGPGSGKGTLCKKMAEKWNFIHISTGEALRNQVKKDPQALNNRLISKLMENGQLLPTSTMLILLEKEMLAEAQMGKKGFLLDGFPRTLESALLYESKVRRPEFIVSLTASDETLKQRALQRNEGRDDDNEETFQQRLKVFHEEHDKIVQHEKFVDYVVEVNAEGPIDEVFQRFENAINEQMNKRNTLSLT